MTLEKSADNAVPDERSLDIGRATTMPEYEDWETLLDAMVRIRCFEDEVKGLFASGLVRGSTHLCQGQEAVSVGACSRLEDGDTMTCTYRGHGAVLAKGAADGGLLRRDTWSSRRAVRRQRRVHALRGFPSGCNRGNAIVGAHLPIAVGAAFAHQYKGTDRVSLAFTGDGSTNIGAFHEAMNLAAVWRLPLIVIIENNHYGEYSPQASTTPITRLAERAVSYGIPGVYVDGNDVLAVIGATAAAIARARIR